MRHKRCRLTIETLEGRLMLAADVAAAVAAAVPTPVPDPLPEVATEMAVVEAPVANPVPDDLVTPEANQPATQSESGPTVQPETAELVSKLPPNDVVEHERNMAMRRDEEGKLELLFHEHELIVTPPFSATLFDNPADPPETEFEINNAEGAATFELVGSNTPPPAADTVALGGSFMLAWTLQPAG